MAKKLSKWDIIFKDFTPTFRGQVGHMGLMEVDWERRLFKTYSRHWKTDKIKMSRRGVIDRLTKNCVWVYKGSRNINWQFLEGKGASDLEEIYADQLLDDMLRGIELDE